MDRRVTMTRSRSKARPKMNASVVLLLCGVVGIVLAEYPARQVPYNVGPNNQYSVAVNPNFSREQSARLFWSNQGSNQVGGTGLWATLTNKFPILNNMFGRMELANEYGVPQYNTPGNYEPYYQTYQPAQVYRQPQYQYQQPQQLYQQQQYQQQPQFYQQPFRQRAPFGRDVGFTDDAVIVTPPQVPVVAPQPQPLPAPAGDGYSYNKPQYRLDLPHK